MTPRMARDCPLVVLVGGRLTLRTGETLDARQPSENAKAARAIRDALCGTSGWWNAVSSIVLPTIAAPGSSARVVGPRSVSRQRPDGTVVRSRLRSLLKGRVESVRHDPRHEPELRWFAHADATAPQPLRSAEAIVDVTGRYLASLIRSSHYVATECRFLFRDAPRLIVMPDIADLRQALEGFVSGETRAGDILRTLDALNPPFLSTLDEQDPQAFLRICVVAAECTVTGLLREGAWMDPAPLEAARIFLLERFDLKLGLWDVAFNSALRQALLRPNPLLPAPDTPVAIPEFDRLAAVGRMSARKQRRSARESEARFDAESAADACHELHKTLGLHGWDVHGDGHPRGLRLALIPAPAGQVPRGSPVFLYLQVRKDDTELGVWNQYYNNASLSEFIDRVFSETNDPSLGKPEPASLTHAVLWRTEAGWGTAGVDWASIATEAVAATRRWAPVFRKFAADALAARLRAVEAWRRRVGKEG